MLDKAPESMTDEELVNASFSLAKMLDDLKKKQQSPKFRAKFVNQPMPTVNPMFTELKTRIDTEMMKRKNNV